jgi:hypothetical protein
MKTFKHWMVRVSRGFSALALVALTGCASFYVDSGTKGVDPAQFQKTSPQHPVQVVFEFQTKGVANARATEHLKAGVLAQVKQSGVFSDATEAPVEGGAMLSVTLNNVPLTDDAFSKGFVTGLTFGLAGSQVSDGYVCTASYTPPGSKEPIVRQARHAIHTTMGNSAAPGNATKMPDIGTAVTTMQQQVVSTVLNDVTHDPNFK